MKSVGIYPTDQSGSGFYRMSAPGAAVAATGKPVVVLPRSPYIGVDQYGNIKGINVGSLDCVVFQRPAKIEMLQVIPLLQKQGVKVICDFDDSLSTIPQRSIAFKTYDPRVSHKINWMIAAKAAEMADLVTCATDGLLEEYGYGHGLVIPNFIPESYLRIPRPVNEVPIITWTGWTSTHIGDLSVTHGSVNQVLAETNSKFAAFGDENIFRDLGIRRRPPHELWSFESLPNYPGRLVGADIGLVPLAKNEFNKSKSFLKGIEYMSLGIVPVVSPTTEYQKLIDMGAAIPASTPKEWHDRIQELVVDHEYRNEMSKKVRELASGLTIEKNTDLWWNAWSS